LVVNPCQSVQNICVADQALLWGLGEGMFGFIDPD